MKERGKPKKMDKIYVKSENNEIVLYQGGPNFLEGERICKRCNSFMEKLPIGQQYVRVEGGKILVNICQKTGKLFVVNYNPDYIWVCENEKCPEAISMVKKVY